MPPPPAHVVGACAAVEKVVARIARERIGERITCARKIGDPGQHQVLDIAAEREAHRCPDRVGALAVVLRNPIADIVDHIGVVAVAARHRVAADAAIKKVVAPVAREDVGKRVAGAVDAARRRSGPGSPRCRRE